MDPLPFELVSRVFRIGAGEFHSSPLLSAWSSVRGRARNYRGLSDYRLAISAVNARWRQIALSTLALWAQIDVSFVSANFYTLELSEFESRLRMLELLLQRTDGCPLDLSLRLSRFGAGEMSRSTVDAVWALALPHLWRCCRLEVTFALYPIRLLGSFPYLETLSVDPGRCKVEDLQQLAVFDRSSQFPHLRNLQIHRAASPYVTSEPPNWGLDLFQLSTLTRLAVDPVDLTQSSKMLEVVAGCRSLTHLELNVASGFPSGPLMFEGAPSNPISLPHLEYLSTDIYRFEEHISAPRLRCLYVQHDFDVSLSSFPSLQVITLLSSASPLFTAEPSSPLWSIPIIELPFTGHAYVLLLSLLQRAPPVVANSPENSPSPSGPRLIRLGSVLSPHDPSTLEPDSIEVLRDVMLAYPALRVECTFDRHVDRGPLEPVASRLQVNEQRNYGAFLHGYFEGIEEQWRG